MLFHKNIDKYFIFSLSIIISIIIVPLQVDISKVNMLCQLLKVLLLVKGGPDLKMDIAKLHPLLCTTFVFCFVWSIGGNLTDNNWDAFDTFTRQLFEDNGDAKVCLKW